MTLKNHMIKWCATLLFGMFVAYEWGYINPHILSFQEQYQLFLCTSDYFVLRMSLPGGLADYLGEFITQFYYFPMLGACCLALLLMVMQQLTWVSSGSRNLLYYAISFFPPLLLLAFMGDENLMLSFGVAGTIALALHVLMKQIDRWSFTYLLDLIIVPVFYWLIGPMVWMYVLLRCFRYTRKWWGGIVALELLLVQLLCYATILQQWPLENTFLGLTYYRIPYMLPQTIWLWPLIVVALIGLTHLSWFQKRHSNTMVSVAALVVVAVIGCFAIQKSYDEDKYEIIRQDYLVRSERWDEIISRAEKHQVNHPFSSQSVNLALAMKRQLADRMFSFYQCGVEALIMPMVRDMVTDLPSAEAFYRLGMVNSAQRYFSDIQESILSYRKSGRCTQRIVECMIVNGKYDLARKQIDLLKKSLFYSEWARDAERYLGDEAWIENHPVWGKLRKYRFNDDFLYSYGEREKMFGLLFVNNSENKMALDYLMAQLLLNGNIQDFMKYMSWVQQFGGYKSMPAGYQDAIKCIQNQGNVPNSPYAAYVQKMSKGNNQNVEENDTAH